MRALFSQTVFFITVFPRGFFSPKLLKFGLFPVLALGSEPAVASVSIDDISDVINVSPSEVPDAKVLKLVE